MLELLHKAQAGMHVRAVDGRRDSPERMKQDCTLTRACYGDRRAALRAGD